MSSDTNVLSDPARRPHESRDCRCPACASWDEANPIQWREFFAMVLSEWYEWLDERARVEWEKRKTAPQLSESR